MEIYDSHAHYDDAKFDHDRESIIEKLIEDDVKFIVNVGSSMEGCYWGLYAAYRYDFMYATVGIHPSWADQIPDNYIDILKTLSSEKKVLAIGEMGLDYFYKEPSKERQNQVFKEQLDLAEELKMPVIIHSREAEADTIAQLTGRDVTCIIHCFPGSAETAKRYVAMGHYLGFGGVLTFKNSKVMKEALAATPLDRIIFETDSPYLAPEPRRGKRNSSANIVHVAQCAADIKGIPLEKMLEISRDNMLKFYRLEK